MALKTTLLDAKDRLDALLTYANTATGESDTSIGDAIEKLVDMANDHTLEDALIQNTRLEVLINTTVTENVMEYTFYNRNFGIIHLTKASTIRASAFQSCKATEIYVPSASTIQTNAFRLCENLRVCDIGKPNLLYNLFQSDSNLEVLIIRKWIEPSNSNAFVDTKLGVGKAGGYVYVPQQYLTQYQNSSAWASYANVLEFRAIEGSIYE